MRLFECAQRGRPCFIPAQRRRVDLCSGEKGYCLRLDHDPAFWVASGLDPERVAVLADHRVGRLTCERNGFAAKGLEEEGVGGEVHDPRCVAVTSVKLHR